jgi:hypothetical protein
MVRDGGLAELKLVFNIADANLAGKAAEEIYDLEAHWMAKSLKHGRQLFGLSGWQAQAGRKDAADVECGLGVVEQGKGWIGCEWLVGHGRLLSVTLMVINIKDKSKFVNMLAKRYPLLALGFLGADGVGTSPLLGRARLGAPLYLFTLKQRSFPCQNLS